MFRTPLLNHLKLKIMSHNVARIPTTDEDKNNYYGSVVPFINNADNQLRFKSVPANLTTLNNKFGLWSPNWIKLNDSNLCTHTVVALKNSLEVDIDDALDVIYGDIPDSVLTVADKKEFLMFERKVPSSAVASPVSPALIFDSMGHLWAKFLFRNTATPTRREAPVGNVVFYETYIGDAGIADAELVFGNGNVSTSAFHTFNFTEDQVGKTCYVRCFYQIKKGDRSPGSKIVSFMLS